MTTEEVIEFATKAQTKSPEEVREFFKKYREEYPDMSDEDKAYMAKHWDIFEFLQMLK